LVNIEGIESKLKNLLQQLNDYFEILDRNDAEDDFPCKPPRNSAS
jgi:hypothetical protein